METLTKIIEGKLKKIRLIDGCFPGNPSSIAGDNVWRGPQHFEWCRDLNWCDSLITFYTNWMLEEARKSIRHKVVWLLEPPSIQDWPYKFVARHRGYFKTVLTYDKRLLDSNDNRFKFAPHGGSWIDWDLWGMHPKTKDVCMIVSDKKDSEGHKLRHKIAKEFGDRIDVYGPSYQRFDRKWDVLRHYRYCVVVESIKMDYYFSEKLIDAISVGCIPIYWGCPSIDVYFQWGRAWPFINLEELDDKLEFAVPLFYENMKNAGYLSENLETAKQYRMPEDWMFDHYPELFE